MSKRKQSVRLYNVMFPVWFLFLFPMLWIWILPANFLIDSLVLILAMTVFHYENRMQVWKKSILKVWIIGFLSDIAGALLVFGIYLLLETYTDLALYCFPMEQLIILPGLAAAGVLIYFLNRRFSFRKTELTGGQIHRLSLVMAIVTAPYTMLIPLSWIYY